MRKFCLLVILLLLSALTCLAQFTTVTATVHDPNNVTYAGGTYSAVFIPPYGWPNIFPATAGDGTTFNHYITGSLDSNGHFSVSLADTTQISPTRSQWSITVCPNVGFNGCTFYIGAISGTSQDISTQLDNNAPVITAQANFQKGIGAGLNIPLPQAVKGTIAVALNGNSATDCTVGGGTAHVFCEFNGTTWVQFGGSSGTTFPLLAPNGSLLAPSYSFANAPNTGIFWDGFNLQIKVGNGNGGIVLNGINIPDVGGNRLQFGGPLQDTGFYREAATVLDLGTGGNNDTSGTMKLTSLVFANTGAYWTNDYIVTTAGEATISAANAIKTWGIYLDKTLTVGSFCWFVSTADNTANLYDYGIYDNAGNLKGHLGATAGTTFSPNNGFQCHATSAGFTLVPGRYYIAETSNCAATCAQLGGPGAYASFNTNTTVVTTSTGGTLPATMTPAADVWTWTTGEPMFVMHP